MTRLPFRRHLLPHLIAGPRDVLPTGHIERDEVRAARSDLRHRLVLALVLQAARELAAGALGAGALHLLVAGVRCSEGLRGTKRGSWGARRGSDAGAEG